MAMGRRRAMRGVLGAVGALVLGGLVSGCGPSKEDIGADLRAAAEAVEGVDSVEAEVDGGGEFETWFSGVISIDASDRAELLRIYDAALGAVVRRIAEAGYSEHMSLKDLVGRAEAGEVTVFDLEPTLTRSSRHIHARLLFERYGVDG